MVSIFSFSGKYLSTPKITTKPAKIIPVEAFGRIHFRISIVNKNSSAQDNTRETKITDIHSHKNSCSIPSQKNKDAKMEIGSTTQTLITGCSF